MRHVPLIIGSTLLALALVQPVQAAECPSPLAQAAQNLEPVSSHYTQRVIQRVRGAQGGGNGAGNFLGGFLGWAQQQLAGILRQVDSELLVVQEVRSLRSQTGCMYVDALILEAELERLRCEMQDALENSDLPGITRLTAMRSFVSDRLKALLRGAGDPEYIDLNWHRYQVFDRVNSGWCALDRGIAGSQRCEQRSPDDCFSSGGVALYDSEGACRLSLGLPIEDDSDLLCPFHSDYLPPTADGFGCSPEILAPYQDLDPVRLEYEALEELVSARQSFEESLEQWRETLGLENDAPLPLSMAEEHQTIAGCLVPTKTSVERELHSEGATLWSPRAPFSLDEDQPGIMQRYLELRQEQGQNRRMADYLLPPHERRNAREGELDFEGYLESAIRSVYRLSVEAWNTQQAGRESAIIGRSVDSLYTREDGIKHLRQSVRSLAEMAVDEAVGPRQFVNAFAWYLRRSCLFNPCSTQLDNILRINETEECFPYTDGSYRDSQNVWQDCQRAL